MILTFTGSGGASGTYVTGTFNGQADQTFNAVNTHTSNTTNWSTFTAHTTTGQDSALKLSTSNIGGAGGDGGMVQTEGQRADAAVGADWSTVFGSDIVVGPSASGGYGGVSNDRTGASQTSVGTSGTWTLTGLTAGQSYDLYVLTGRGNNAATALVDGVVTYTLSGFDESASITGTLLGASSSQSSADGATFVSYEYNAGTSDTNWAMVKWSFTAGTDGSVTITPTGDGVMANLNALAITATSAAPAVPEPATATLSLLALAGMAARRRRK